MFKKKMDKETNDAAKSNKGKKKPQGKGNPFKNALSSVKK